MEFKFYLEVINTVLGVMAIVYAVKVMQSVQGGIIENVWKYIGIASFFFGIMEIVGFLDAIKIFAGSPINLETARKIVEFITIASLMVALAKAKKVFRI